MKFKHWLAVFLITLACMECPIPCQSQPATSAKPAKAYEGANKTLVPSAGWSCGMAEGIPVPELGVKVFEVTMKLDGVHRIGRTLYGDRVAYVLQTGTITGEKVSGTIVSGGLDFELNLTNGTTEVEQIFVLRLNDNRYVYLRSAGVGADARDIRMVPVFAAPNAGGFGWLNTGKFVGRRVVDEAAKTMKLVVFDVSAVAIAKTNLLTITKPANVPEQPWDYRRATPDEKRGDMLITENVTLAGSQSVGATPRGNWNIIPITGGTLTGKIEGKVLSGGADYQNLAGPATIDARYLWQTSEGEVIIVRNAGPFSSLCPTFEVRLDSKYAYLNQGKYLSSGPSMGTGGVKLSFYDSVK